MERFPQYKHRDFYLSGESYAGHYVPQLANKIYDYNNKASNPIINLKGFIVTTSLSTSLIATLMLVLLSFHFLLFYVQVGNADTDTKYDYIGTVNYWWSHALISDHTYNLLLNSCNNTFKNTSQKCQDAQRYSDQEIGNINQYNIYTETCNASAGGSKRFLRRGNNLRVPRFSGYDPCTENYAEIYYNRLDVQKAMHANTTRIPYKWTACRYSLCHSFQCYTSKDKKVTTLTILPLTFHIFTNNSRIHKKWLFFFSLQ